MKSQSYVFSTRLSGGLYINAGAKRFIQSYFSHYSEITAAGWQEQTGPMSSHQKFVCLQGARSHVEQAAELMYDSAVVQIAFALWKVRENGLVKFPCSSRQVAYHSATSAVVAVRKKQCKPETVVTPNDDDNISNCRMLFPPTASALCVRNRAPWHPRREDTVGCQSGKIERNYCSFHKLFWVNLRNVQSIEMRFELVCENSSDARQYWLLAGTLALDSVDERGHFAVN